MKRVLAITAAVLLACAALARAQSSAATPSSKPLAEVAKQEEERRKAVKQPAKVYTNGSLRSDISKGVDAPPSTSSSTTPSNSTPSNATPAAPGATPPAAAKDQAYWQDRIKTARDQVQRTQIFADALQSRINALQTDFVARDDPAQKAKVKGDLDTALAELERVKKELADQTKAITAIEEEARRAGVPSGWLRPGA